MGRSGGALALVMVLGACESPQIEPNIASAQSIARGQEAAERLGCGACHVMPGIAWPQGRTGPSLERFAGNALIAGTLPNRPDVLARFVRDAPSQVPGSAMPAIAMSSRDAADIAAYLQARRGE
jgi:cytochrome c2